MMDPPDLPEHSSTSQARLRRRAGDQCGKFVLQPQTLSQCTKSCPQSGKRAGTQKSSNCKFHYLKSTSDNDIDFEQHTTHRLRPSREVTQTDIPPPKKKKNIRATAQRHNLQERKRRHDDASNRTLLRALIDLTRSASWPRG
jgi:hypothetical protein